MIPYDLTNEEFQKITLMYLEGSFDTEVQSFLFSIRKGFTKQTWDEWVANVSEFGSLVEQGKIDREAYWIRLGVDNIENRSFNSGLWSFIMKNQFKWKDNVTIGGDKDNPMKIDTEITIKLIAPESTTSPLMIDESSLKLVN